MALLDISKNSSRVSLHLPGYEQPSIVLRHLAADQSSKKVDLLVVFDIKTYSEIYWGHFASNGEVMDFIVSLFRTAIQKYCIDNIYDRNVCFMYLETMSPREIVGDVVDMMSNMPERKRNNVAAKAALKAFERKLTSERKEKEEEFDKKEAGRQKEKIARAEMLHTAIKTLRPKTVLTFGHDPCMALNEKQVIRANGQMQAWFGVPIPTTVESHEFTHFPCFSISKLLKSDYKGNSFSLFGYAARCLANCLSGRVLYQIPKLDYKVVFVNTIAKFDAMLDVLYAAKVVAIDTETTSLKRVTNTMLTIQFSPNTEVAYVLPYKHKDSPFSKKELVYIKDNLCEFFTTNDNDFHIFTNASFDLGVIKSELDVIFYKAELWDIFAGEWCLDENYKFLKLVTRLNYYSLFNIASQYGCTAYMDIEFGKQHRKIISSVDLTPSVLEYCALDCIVPFHIARLQLKKANALGYKKYKLAVTMLVSSIIHNFAIMENNGLLVDLDYLFSLRRPDSPIDKVISDIRDKLYSMPSVVSLNKKLIRENNVQLSSLFGRHVQYFALNKPAHRQRLFIEELGLTPLNVGKNGPSIDKKFQTTYSSVEEVSLYSSFVAAQKLRDAYVNQFLRFWATDSDFKKDRRIRPRYSYLGVVTGRTSASDPSLHQIPARSALGKHIKRLFIARPETLFIKVDYSSHEVRCWANVSKDQKLADVFEKGRSLRNEYELYPSEELKSRIKNEGDVHRINAAFFFKVLITEVTDELRNATKGVVFGQIYGQAVHKLAEKLGMSYEDMKSLIDMFFAEFKDGTNWFSFIENYAKANLYVESPIGRRRNLYGYMYPKDGINFNAIVGSMNRRARNSVIQGFGSDLAMLALRLFEKYKHRFYLKNNILISARVCNSVHDSVELEVAYEHIYWALTMVRFSMTRGVSNLVRRVYNFNMVSEPEIDFEIGATARDMHKWDSSYANLCSIFDKSLRLQKEMEYDIDVPEALKRIQSGVRYAPEYLLKQISLSS